MAIPFSPERKFLSPKLYVEGQPVIVRQPHGVVLGKVVTWASDGFHRNKIKVIVDLEHRSESRRVIKAGKMRPLE